MSVGMVDDIVLKDDRHLKFTTLKSQARFLQLFFLTEPEAQKNHLPI